VGNAIFGGSAEYVALGLKTLGREEVFLRLCVGHVRHRADRLLLLPDLRKVSYLNDED
jgi:hypothetical protein